MALAAHQSIIRKLYCEENMTLGDLRQYMEREIGISVSEDTYKRWFRKWGLCKNRRGDIWIWANHRIEKRKAGQDNKKTEIHFNGTVINHKRVQKEIARHVSTMDRIEARASSPLTPQGYSIATPLGSTPDLPDTSASATTADSNQVAVQNHTIECEFLVEVMQNCGSFMSFWSGRGLSISKQNHLAAYTSIADAIVTATFGTESHAQRVVHLVPMAGFRILHATYSNDFQRLRLQLAQNDLTYATFQGIMRTARFIAAGKGCSGAAKALFYDQEHVDSRDAEGKTCLHLATIRNHPEMVDFLITRNSDVNSRRRDGQTVWTQICVSEEHERVSQLLIEAGADVNCLVNHVSPLHLAAAGGHIHDVCLLLRRGVNPSLSTALGWTPLSWATQNNHTAVVRLLVDAGADVYGVFNTAETLLGDLANRTNGMTEYSTLQHGVMGSRQQARRELRRELEHGIPATPRSDLHQPFRLDASLPVPPDPRRAGLSVLPSQTRLLDPSAYIMPHGESFVPTGLLAPTGAHAGHFVEDLPLWSDWEIPLPQVPATAVSLPPLFSSQLDSISWQ